MLWCDDQEMGANFRRGGVQWNVLGMVCCWNVSLDDDDFYAFQCFIRIVTPKKGDWATPGDTAIPGQPVGWAKQASIHIPSHKNLVNSLEEHVLRSSY